MRLTRISLGGWEPFRFVSIGKKRNGRSAPRGSAAESDRRRTTRRGSLRFGVRQVYDGMSDTGSSGTGALFVARLRRDAGDSWRESENRVVEGGQDGAFGVQGRTGGSGNPVAGWRPQDIGWSETRT